MKGRSIQIRSPMLVSAFLKARFRHLVKKIKMAVRILQSCHILEKNHTTGITVFREQVSACHQTHYKESFYFLLFCLLSDL
jgi:hypothetical protein